MEGENKNMKMKKLTALALAGVLCMGMSATAFAAGSPVSVDGENTKVTITEKNEITGEETTKDLDGSIQVGGITNGFANKHIADWTVDDDATDEEKAKAQKALEDDIAKAVENANKDLPDGEKIKLDSNAKYLYTGSAADYYFVDENGKEGLPEGAEATIRFNLKNVAGIEDAYKVGSRTIYLMHAVTDEDGNTSFVMLTGEIKDGVNGYYTDVTFKDGLSPVAFVLEVPQKGGDNNGDGDNNGNIVVPNPGDDNTITPTPGTDGKVTVDDIANAVVKKLQSSNAKVIRTGTGVSPKTGE